MVKNANDKTILLSMFERTGVDYELIDELTIAVVHSDNAEVEFKFNDSGGLVSVTPISLANG